MTYVRSTFRRLAEVKINDFVSRSANVNGSGSASANAGIDGVTTGLIPWKVKVNFRENEYAGVGKLSTKMVASFAASPQGT